MTRPASAISQHDEENIDYVLPDLRGGWYTSHVQDEEHCEYLSRVSGALCGWTSCDLGRRPMDIGGGHMYLAALKNILVLGVSENGLEIEGRIGLTRLVKEMRYHDQALYVNLRTASGRLPLVVDVSDPYAPTSAGMHDAEDWVVGLETAYGLVCQVKDGIVRAAEAW